MKIISGMHRSGTSIVARLMFEAGADLGDPETFYRPDKWNSDGYFEQPEFHAINMPLVNGPYWKFSYFRLPSEQTIVRRAARFADAIRAASESYRGKVVKEVRFSLTLPAWQAQGAHFDRMLVCLREPLEVAQSVQRRNHIGLRRGYKLWCEHYERLLGGVGDLPLRLIRYSNLIDPGRFEAELVPALEFFGLDHDSAMLKRLASLMREPGNRVADAGELRYPDHVARLWADLQARHAAQFEGAAVNEAVHG